MDETRGGAEEGRGGAEEALGGGDVVVGVITGDSGFGRARASGSSPLGLAFVAAVACVAAVASSPFLSVAPLGCGLAFEASRLGRFFALPLPDLGGGGGAFFGPEPARGGGRSERLFGGGGDELEAFSVDAEGPPLGASGARLDVGSEDGGCSSAIDPPA